MMGKTYSSKKKMEPRVVDLRLFHRILNEQFFNYITTITSYFFNDMMTHVLYYKTPWDGFIIVWFYGV